MYPEKADKWGERGAIIGQYYSKDSDRDLARDMIAPIGAADWTPYFMPSHGTYPVPADGQGYFPHPGSILRIYDARLGIAHDVQGIAVRWPEQQVGGHG